MRQSVQPERGAVMMTSRKDSIISVGTTSAHSLRAFDRSSDVIPRRHHSISSSIESGTPGVRISSTSLTASRARYLSKVRTLRTISSSAGSGCGTSEPAEDERRKTSVRGSS